MTLEQALAKHRETGCKIRIVGSRSGFLAPTLYLANATMNMVEHWFEVDWECEEKSITVTREDVSAAINRIEAIAFSWNGGDNPSFRFEDLPDRLCKELGL